MEKLNSGEALTETEDVDLGKAQSEIAAIAAENVLGNADFIRRLVKGEPSRAEKILGKIVQIKNVLTGNSEANAQAAFVRKAEKLYLDAIAELGGTYRDGKIHLANREEDELTRENAENVQVSGKNTGERLRFSRFANDKIVSKNGQNVLQNGQDVTENVPFVSETSGGVIESKNTGTIAPKNVDNYTEEQYNNFGWVRTNDVLNSGEWKDFTSKFAAAVSKQTKPPKTKSGEYMIAVSDIDDPMRYGIDNIIVYAKGKIENPHVSRVLEIDLDNETDLDRKRREIYDFERRGIQQKAGGLCRFYYAADYGNQYDGQGTRRSGFQDSSQLGADRGRGRKAANHIKEFKINEDGNFTTVYADGSVEHEALKEKKGEDILFSRKAPTDGQAAKDHADRNYGKIYTKKDAREIISAALTEHLTFEEDGVFGNLVGKSRDQAIEVLWKGLNSAEEGKRAGLALDMADFIIENAVAEDLYDDGDTAEQMERLKILRGYMHKLDLRKIEKADAYLGIGFCD